MLPAFGGHRALARSFPSCLSPHVFPSTQLWAGSLGICIKTQRKRIVLFLPYKSTLLILTPTVPSPVLTSGEPLALRVFVSRPKTATAGKGGKILETKQQVCAVSQCTNPLVIQQQEKGLRRKIQGNVGTLWARLCTCVFISCLSAVENKKLMTWAVVRG